MKHPAASVKETKQQQPTAVQIEVVTDQTLLKSQEERPDSDEQTSETRGKGEGGRAALPEATSMKHGTGQSWPQTLTHAGR